MLALINLLRQYVKRYLFLLKIDYHLKQNGSR
jgi:hypothetical protein